MNTSAETPGKAFPDKRTAEAASKVEKRGMRSTKNKYPRIPGMPTDKLEVRNRQAGMHYAWIVDDRKGRLEEFLAAGYAHVQQSDPEVVSEGDMTSLGDNSMDSKVSKVVNSDGTVAYLLRIPEEVWHDHQAWRDEQSMAPIKQIKEGKNIQEEGLYHISSKLTRE